MAHVNISFGVNSGKWFTFKNLRLHDCMELSGSSAPTEPCKKNQGENLKAIQILIPSKSPNLIPNSLPEISIIVSA